MRFNLPSALAHKLSLFPLHRIHGVSELKIILMIPRIESASASPALLRHFLDSNAPFLITDLASRWEATRAWVVPGEEENFQTLDLFENFICGHNRGELAEETLVPVVECPGDDDKHENVEGHHSHTSNSCQDKSNSYGTELRTEMHFTEYARLWRTGEAEARGLYLKDWHIVKVLKGLDGKHDKQDVREEVKAGIKDGDELCDVLATGKQGVQEQRHEELVGACGAEVSPSRPTAPSALFSVPFPLTDDWLNAWWDAPASEAGHPAREDDYRFLYLGPAGTQTGLHHDVLYSYSWSANLAGTKEWTLIHPDQKGNLAENLPLQSTVPFGSVDWSGVAVRVRQGPGEMIFVPSGWFHRVRNVTGCLSINHNWFNRSSLDRVWTFVKEEASAVQERLYDLRETFDASLCGWERQCEVVMRANSSINLTEWVDLLLWKARDLRLRQKDTVAPDARLDLLAILKVLREVQRSERYVNFLFPSRFHEEPSVENLRPLPLPLQANSPSQTEEWLAAEIQQLEKCAERLVG